MEGEDVYRLLGQLRRKLGKATGHKLHHFLYLQIYFSLVCDDVIVYRTIIIYGRIMN